ncbi:Methyltransferase domain-containing protein [Friedmanniella luteola]|uniref:Methyltransferase domain-containing protein n=1 Tax=Friedmanniella luteola TaxID=546871 RepID=A0A1H2A235_9ACTN|nr:class I SAM-dependent methyltransferase [Friedmanniella luteola]SDT39556.1 Methyltransferase domain-containing protein [Friedmanniella luteola]
MTEEMKAEFDTVASWTADAALALGPDHFLAAGCRGSGSPGALRWLLDRLDVAPGDLLLDAGAGVGGPAAFAAAEAGVRPLLSEPEAGACRAARRLFDLPVVQAASALPFADASVDAVWSLGVLCTVPDQPRFVAELRRVLRPGGRLGLLVFVATGALPEQPAGNDFPTRPRLDHLLREAGLTVHDSGSAADFPATPAGWQDRADAVDAELERRHGDDEAWRTAEAQSAVIGRLLAAGDLVGTLVVAGR